MRRELLIAIFLIVVVVAVYLSVQKPAQPALACPKECVHGCLPMTTKCVKVQCPSSCKFGCIPNSVECKQIELAHQEMVEKCGSVNKSMDVNFNLNSEGTCLTIQNDSLVLDCGGHSITGSWKNGSYGIYIGDRKNITIMNCIIKDYDSGIAVNSSSNISLLNMRLEGNLDDGALINSSDGVSVTGMDAANNGMSGLELDSSSGINVTGSTLYKNPFGIRMQLTNRTIISGNKICSSLITDVLCDRVEIDAGFSNICDYSIDCAVNCSPCSASPMYTQP